MSHFNGRMYFLGAVYHIRGRFSLLSSFMRELAPHFTDLPYENAPVLEKVQQLREEFSGVNKSIGGDEALKRMLAEDLDEIEKVLHNDAIVAEIEMRRDFESVLETCKDKAVALLQSMGVHIEPPEIFYPDELPERYSSQGYSALTADRGDSERYGITPGIYFPPGRLRPFYSEFLLMHELIHVIFGKASPYMLARGLEEGLAELVGAMYLSSQILGKELTVNLFIYNRLSDAYQQYWEMYLDAARQAALLHHRFGLGGIMALLNKGREELRAIEGYCSRMEFDKIDLPRGEENAELADIADYLALAFSRNLVVSPLAKYLTYYVRPGQSVSEILRQSRVEEIAGKKALRELETRVNLISFSDNINISNDVIVNWTDCDQLCESPEIRYGIPEVAQERKTGSSKS